MGTCQPDQAGGKGVNWEAYKGISRRQSFGNEIVSDIVNGEASGNEAVPGKAGDMTGPAACVICRRNVNQEYYAKPERRSFD